MILNELKQIVGVEKNIQKIFFIIFKQTKNNSNVKSIVTIWGPFQRQFFWEAKTRKIL